MCRWIAYLGQPTYINEFLYDGPRSLCAQAQQSHKAKLGVHGDGGGLGWYGNQECPGLYRNPGPAWGDPNLRDLTSQIESRLFFAHVRASTGAPNTFVNCHPFRKSNWLFMHNGQIGDFPLVQRQLEQSLDDQNYADIEGTTDSELLFALLVSNGLYEQPEKAIRQTLGEVAAICEEKGASSSFRATFAVANGDEIWATRWSTDAYAPSLYQRVQESNVLLASEPLDNETSDWQEIAPNSLVKLKRADNGTSIDIQPLFEAGVQHVRAV